MNSAWTKQRILLSMVCLLVSVSIPIRAAEDANINFSFDQVSIRSFVKLVGDVTGKKFVVSDDVEGSITVVAPRIKRDEVFPIFVSILESAGCSVVDASGIYRVIRLQSSGASLAPVVGEGEPTPTEGGLVTKVLHLRHVTASEVAKSLASKVSGTGGIRALGAIDETNHLIVTDTVSGVRRIEAIIAQVDRPGLARLTEVVGLKHTGAEEMAAQIAAAMRVQDTRGESLRKRLSSGAGYASGRAASVVAAPHSNQLILIGSAEQIAEMRQIVTQMDVEAPAGSGRLHAIFLKYLTAEEAAKSLSALLDMSAGKAEEGGVRRGRIAIQASVANNALLVDCSTSEFAEIKNLIDTLDLKPEQVHVSVLIAEVSVGDQLDFGVEMFAVDMPDSAGDTVMVGGSLFQGGENSILNNIQNGLFPNGITLGAAHGSSVNSDGNISLGYPGLINIEAIKRDSRFNLVSETSLEAQDNREASVMIVEDIPVLKSTIQGGSGSSRDVIQNIDRVDVGIKLRLTPHIVPGGQVQMDLNPAIEAIIDSSTEVAFTPTIARREVSTTITVPDGRTIVIAGLTREDKTKVMQKVPLLGDIPLLGFLFRKQSDKREKTNLLIFVTPRIVGDMLVADEIKAEWEEKTGLSGNEAP